MLNKEAHEKILAEILEAVNEAEGLYRQHSNDVIDDDGVSAQVKSYRLLRREVNRCRQLKGLLDAEKLKYDNKRLENIIEAFDALEEPKLEKILLF